MSDTQTIVAGHTQPCLICDTTPTAYIILTPVIGSPAEHREIVGYLCEACYQAYYPQTRKGEVQP